MKININWKMDTNTLIFLLIIVIIFFIAVMSPDKKSVIEIASYQNCTCPDNFGYPSYWCESDEFDINDWNWTVVPEYKKQRFYTISQDSSMFDNCTEIPCECHKWGCALMCMKCPDTISQSTKN